MNPWIWVSLALYILGAYQFLILISPMEGRGFQHMTKPIRYILAAVWPFLVFWAFLGEI